MFSPTVRCCWDTLPERGPARGRTCRFDVVSLSGVFAGLLTVALVWGAAAPAAGAGFVELEPFASSAPGRLEFHVLLSGFAFDEGIKDATTPVIIEPEAAALAALTNTNGSAFTGLALSNIASCNQGPLPLLCMIIGGSEFGAVVFPNWDTDGLGGNDAFKLGELSLDAFLPVTMTVQDQARYSTATGVRTVVENANEVIFPEGEPPDTDGDGVPDDMDECPNSDLSPTVVIDGCDSGVPNHLFEDGCTISDLVTECADGARNHGAFRRCVSKLGNALKKDGVITPPEKDQILSCASRADIP